MTTIIELRAQAEALLLKAEQQEQAEKTTLFEGIMEKLHGAGHTLSDLQAFAKPLKKHPSSGQKLPALFRGPSGEEWSGRGHHPDWLKHALEAGKQKTDFAIN